MNASSRWHQSASIVLPLALLVLWQIAATLYATPLFPGPLAVGRAIIANGPEIIGELGHTLLRACLGFALAAATMIPLGIFLGRVQLLGQVLEPLMSMIATLPPPAVLPLVMLFSGTGDWAKIVLIGYAAGVPLLMNTYEAANGIHPMLTLLAR